MSGMRPPVLGASSPSALASGNGGNDAYIVTRLNWCVAVLEEPDVFLIDVHVDEPADLTGIIDKSIPDSRVAGLQFGYRACDRARFHLHQLGLVGQLAEWCWNANFDGHIS